MRLRYTLNNEIEGEHICTYSPKGWQDTELVLKRHDKYDGIFKDYTVKVDFFCGAGKEYVDNIYDTQGIEAEVSVTIEMDCDDSGEYSRLYSGRLIMKSYERIFAAPEYTRFNLEQSGIVQTVLNRMEAKVNLSSLETLDGDSLAALTYLPYELTLHSKELFNSGQYRINSGANDFDYDTANIHVVPLEVAAEEIELMETPFSYDVPNTCFTNIFDFSRTINIEGRLKLSNIASTTLSLSGGGGTPTYNYTGGFLIRALVLDESNVTVSSITLHTEAVIPSVTAQTFDFTFSGSVTVAAGHSITIIFFNQYELDLLLANTGSSVTARSQHFTYYVDESYININETSVTDSSTCNAYAIFETGADIARKITGQADAFRSNYFGRKNSQPYAYDENGCGSFRAFTNGFQVRGFPIADEIDGDEVVQPGKPVFMSLKEFYEGLTAIDCLGIGVKEDADGNVYIEIEPKDYFYSNEIILAISNIRSLKTSLNPNNYYNLVKIGYSNWRKEGTNGLDEFCTAHEYNLLFKSISQTLDAVSNFIAGPYAIERQRRLQYIESFTEDSDYDNNNFIICLNRSVDGSGNPDALDVAEKNENFPTVTNLLSPETSYNIRISPARNLRNWFKVIGTGLIKKNDTLKNIRFGFAEGNYKMTSQGDDTCDPAKQTLIGEGEDIVLQIPNSENDHEPFLTGEIDEFQGPLNFEQYKQLKELDDDGKPNFYKKIAYSTTESDYLSGYILELRYKPITGMASFKMARAYDRTETCSHIYVEDGYVECGYVE